MGVKFDKIETIAMGDSFPLYAVNIVQAGTCYLCVHNQDELSEKQKHHSLIIDVAGETRLTNMNTIYQLVGFMLHVTAKPSTGGTKYRYGRWKVTGKKDSIYIVGQIFNTQQLTPGQWVSQLRDVGETVYSNLVQTNSNQELWTYNLNCQMFAQKLIEHWNLCYPSAVLNFSDLPPPIVDFSLLCIRSSASSRSKFKTSRTNDTDDNDDSDSD